jgi:hypothetical protein
VLSGMTRRIDEALTPGAVADPASLHAALEALA